MKTKAETRLAEKQEPQVDAQGVKAWENCLAGNMPLFFTNTSAKATLTAAVAHCEQLQAKLTASQAAKPATASTPAPAPKAAATAKPQATSGNRGSAQTIAPTMTKPEFDALSPRDKSRFSTTGGRIAESSNGAFVPTPDADSMTMAAFNAMTPAARMAHVKAGGKLTD